MMVFWGGGGVPDRPTFYKVPVDKWLQWTAVAKVGIFEACLFLLMPP